MATKIEPFYEALGEQIRRVRERAALSQAELAERLRPPVTRAAIANIENAKQRVLVHMLVDMAAALGVAVSDLLPGRSRLSSEQPLAPHVLEALAREIGPQEGQALAAMLMATKRRTGS
jgi:transcriptional regulator with XRE-family HTH domain